MTPADIVAEALASGEASTESMTRGACRYAVLPIDLLEAEPSDSEFDEIGWCDGSALASEIDDQGNSIIMVRLDTVLAALAHVAERCAAAEKERDRLRDKVVELNDWIAEGDDRGPE